MNASKYLDKHRDLSDVVSQVQEDMIVSGRFFHVAADLGLRDLVLPVSFGSHVFNAKILGLYLYDVRLAYCQGFDAVTKGHKQVSRSSEMIGDAHIYSLFSVARRSSWEPLNNSNHKLHLRMRDAYLNDLKHTFNQGVIDFYTSEDKVSSWGYVLLGVGIVTTLFGIGYAISQQGIF